MASYLGCSAYLQILAIFVSVGAVIFALLGITRDIWWNNELGEIATQFTEREVDLLRRNLYYLEAAFVILETVGTLMMLVHTIICFRRYEQRFHLTKKSKFLAYFIGGYLILISILTIVSAYRYNERLSIVQKEDTRTYVYKLEELNVDETVQFDRSQSIFYYCHWAHGAPRDWSRLKGLRIKKTGTHICQRYGSKVLAALLSVYAGVLYLFISRFFKSQRRDKEAAHVVLLFELFGDYEEAKAEHFGQPFILKKYKEDLLRREEQLHTDLSPKMKKLVRGEKVPDDERNDHLIMNEKDIYHDELLFSETMEAQDQLLNEQKQMHKARGGQQKFTITVHKNKNTAKVHPEPKGKGKNKRKPPMRTRTNQKYEYMDTDDDPDPDDEDEDSDEEKNKD